MNHQSSTDSSNSSVVSADAISRRAYELWENEGRPEGSDLRHWLQAESEIGARKSEQNTSAASSQPSPASPGSDVRPLQGTRAAAAAGREPKRGSNAPFAATEKNGQGNSQNAARRKPSQSPVL